MHKSSRFCLQPYGGRKTRFTCPSCDRPQEFTRWVDTITGELLPEKYGRCNRLEQCAYSCSPYDQELNGQTYAESVRKEENGTFNSSQRAPAVIGHKPRTASAPTIPDEVLTQSLSHYERNNFALLLRSRLGASVTDSLLQRFEIGTSAYWPGATVFWQRDELGRVRGGQVVLFDAEGHTAKRIGPDGESRRLTTWVHTAYEAHCKKNGKAIPAWLTDYLNSSGQKSPSLYGLAQLTAEPTNRPVAIVEAPKTAVICTSYFPGFTWLAIGALGYLNIDRLRPLKSYPITLFPDASASGNAYRMWCDKAEALVRMGFKVNVSDVLEVKATESQKAAGIDLADLLLDQWAGYPPSWDE
ncbi:DUF6371 domain-containing protein [Hymenobacter sp. CRA2]|uniref:DUF6371 domain-containing protein n=1 Tax=Hymenobacter sp. CRA2 TaxID=1955620 RepID=UPI0009D4A780|nr:hypothetical protein B0919_15880 [Hymenobacter sp. CRA2]